MSSNKDKDKDLTNTQIPTDNDSINDTELINDKKEPTKKNTGNKRKTGVGSKPLKKLSPNMEVFCRHVAKGLTVGEAYLKAYPRLSKESWSALGYKGKVLAQRSLVAKRIDELRKIERAKMEAQATWEKFDSVLALKKVVQSNLNDIERVQSAINDEISLLQKSLDKAIEDGNQEDANRILKKLFNSRKQRASSMYNNVGVVSAVTELNQLQGFYPEKEKEGTNVTATVVFKNEDQLLE